MYEGMWLNNQRHGRGTMSWLDRGERYTGDWVGGVQNGHGEHIWIVSGTDNAQVRHITSSLIMLTRSKATT